MKRQISKFIPKLTRNLRKGDCGRIGIIGGSFGSLPITSEYSGAPYFSAKASLLTGADLVTIICSPHAGTVLKSFSPELIVYPILVDSKATSTEILGSIQTISNLITRLDSIVIGPGLGRDEITLQVIKEIIKKAKALDIPLVLDADALYLIQQDLCKDQPEIVLGRNCVLTPNANEFKRLVDALGYAGKSEEEVLG
jgi:ATP-dependent NAD(P)H-hydrate dehydratase